MESTPPQDKLIGLQDSLDNTDQYARRGALTISGSKHLGLPIYSSSENSKEIVIDHIRRYTKLVLNPNEISVAHRLGQKPTNGEDRRSIRFRLCRRDVADEILAACKEMRPPFFINPSLTPLRSKINFALRKLKGKSALLQYCRANLKGELEAYTGSGGRETAEAGRKLRKTIITTKAGLEKFATQTLGMPLSCIDVNW